MKKTFMRTVGVLSTAAMLAVGAMSITASAEGAAKLSMDQKFAKPGETVEIALNLENFDASWTGLEFLVNYDAKLDAVLDGAGDIDYSYGDAVGAMGKKLSVGAAISKELNEEGQKGFAFAWGTASAVSGNGQLAIFKFTVPADAQPGDEFPINLTVKDGGFIDADKANIAFETVNGWIKIAEETETSTESETTTTTTTTTTEGAVETTAPVETTGATTTTKKPDVKPPKTGVDGAALGVVGMLSAAAAAAVVLKKKKD